MNKELFSYYIFLAQRYICKNLSRSITSIMGIALTVILAFGTLTTGQALFDYDLASMYKWNGYAQITAGYYSEVPLALVDNLEKHELVEDVFVRRDVFEEVDGVETEVEYVVNVRVKDTSNLRASAQQLQKDLHIETIQPIEDIEAQLGQGDSLALAQQRAIIALVAALFVAFSMFIIRNTMMLSVLERRGDYGQLRCVGMSAKQLFTILLTEGLFFSVVGAFVGIGICFGFLKAIEGWLNDYLQLEGLFHFTLYPSNVCMTLLLSVAVTLFALIEPARQAAKTSPVEAMRRKTDIVLSGKRKYKSKKHAIIAFLFGVEGEYARKNISRRPVRMLYLCLGILACVSLVCGVTCFVDCKYATMKLEYQGKNLRFPEVVITDGDYSEEKFQEMEEEFSNIDGLEDMGLWLQKTDYQEDIFDEKLLSQNIFSITHKAYSPEEIKELSKYVVEGGVSYDKMMKENGIIICDYEYRVSDLQSDFNYVDRRTTDYKVGDTITELAVEAYRKCMETGERLMQESGLAEHIEYRREEYSRLSDLAEGEDEEKKKDAEKEMAAIEKKSKQYTGKFLKLLREAGYPVEQTADGTKITEDSSVYRILSAMEYDSFQRGETQTFTIQAIIKEDIFDSGAEMLGMLGMSGMEEEETGKSVFRIIQPRDAVLSQAYNASYFDEYLILPEMYPQWSWGLGIKRNLKKATNDIEEHVKDYYSGEGNGEYYLYAFGALIDIEEMRHVLHMAETIGYGIAGFIGLICLIQIFNTVCASLSLRSKELELYRIVGMGRGQERKMILLEHGFVAFLGIVLAYVLTRIASEFFVNGLLNQDGTFAYEWATVKMLLLCAGIFLLSLLASLAGMYHSKWRRSK